MSKKENESFVTEFEKTVGSCTKFLSMYAYLDLRIQIRFLEMFEMSN